MQKWCSDQIKAYFCKNCGTKAEQDESIQLVQGIISVEGSSDGYKMMYVNGA